MAMLVRPQIEILSDTEKTLAERVVKSATEVNPIPSGTSSEYVGALGGGAEGLIFRFYTLTRVLTSLPRAPLHR